MTDEQKHIESTVRVFIQNKNGEVLLARAVKENNQFAVPGGHIEFGETAVDAAIREVKEEVGLDIKDIEFLTYSETIKDSGHYLNLRFRAKLVDDDQKITLLAEELSEYQWMKPETALVVQDVKPTIKKVLENYFVNTKSQKSSLFGHKCKDCEKLNKECDEYKLGWQRALADYKNLQAETVKRRGEWAQMSEQQILEEFIPVYDHLKMSIAGVDKSDAWVEGVKHVLRQFADILKVHGVEEIKTVGEKFDPAVHEAAGEETVGDEEPGTIIKEIMPGYKMGERVIRAARVIVVK